MPSVILKGGLEALDQSSAPLPGLVEHAAKTLGVDLNQISDPEGQTSYATPESACSFKEQWVLRWLTRTFASALEPSKKPKSSILAVDDFFDTAPWKLMQHLLTVIPRDIQTEILIERKFLTNLSRFLGLYLDRVPRPAQPPPNHIQDAVDERPSKRRRLSPAPPSQNHDKYGLTPHLLRVCSSCASLVSSDDKTTGQIRANFWTSVDDCASILAHSQQIVLNELLTVPEQEQASRIYLGSLLRFWAGRPVAASDSTRLNDFKVFNANCLGPCLELLSALKEIPLTFTSTSASNIRDLEALVASTVLVPLRERFIKKHLASWRGQRFCLSWSAIEPIYRDFMVFLGPTQAPDTWASSTVDLSWKDHVHYLYDIATRLLPKYDLRRRQQEQDWLDALLVVLAYTSCPQLPQLNPTQSGDIELVDAVHASNSTNGFLALGQLARLSTTSRCSPSLVALSYLAAALASWQEMEIPWLALECLLQVHNNLLLPTTDVGTSKFALKELAARVERSTLSQDQYRSLKSGIILPILRAFSRARALKDFVLLWRDNLQEALRVGRSPIDGGGDVAGVQAWQDEDLFDEFTVQVSGLTNNSLSEEIIVDLKQAVGELDKRIGSTLDVFAKIAIASALFRAKVQNRPPHESQDLREIIESVISALQKRSDYQGQRWRLWNLVNSIQTSAFGLVIPDRLLEIDVGPGFEVSIAISQDDSGGPLPRPRYQESLEQFTVLVDGAYGANEGFVSALNASVDQIQAFIHRRVASSGGLNNEPLWSGRSLTICNDEQLVSACVGVLVARPSSLRSRPDFLDCLLRALPQSTSGSTESQELQPSRDSLQSIILAALSAADPRAAKKLRKSLIELFISDNATTLDHDRLRQMIENFMLHDRGAGMLRDIGSTLFEQMRTDDIQSKQPDVLAHELAIMDFISDQHSMAYTKPEGWRTWVLIGESFAKAKPWTDFQSAFACYRCLRNVLGKLWANAAANDSRHGMIDDTLAAVKQIKPSKSKARLAEDLGHLVLSENILGNAGGPASTKSDIKELAAAIDILLVSDLRALARPGSDVTALAQIAILLDTLNSRGRTSYASTQLQHVVETIKKVVVKEPATEETSSAGLRELVLEQCATFEAFAGGDSRLCSLEEAIETLSPSPASIQGATQKQLAKIAVEAETFVRSLKAEERGTCLDFVLQTRLSAPLGVLKPFIITAITVQTDKEDIDRCSGMRAHFAKIACMGGIGTEYELQTLLFALENAKLVLDLHPHVVGQATIDELLAQLALTLSGNGLNEHGEGVSASLIYDRVCAIVGSLLSRFRRRLADRYHLILPVLQQLVRCLFYSEAVVRRARQPTVIGSDPSSFLRSIPSWLLKTSDPLPATSAMEVSRLLSSICNPTVSAAKSSRSRGKGNELHDETKRVKAIAGQHLQYLVMEYCRCTLDGDIGPAVKEKLLPGMYTVLDAMNRDLMRAMNAAMDPSSRAIFKTLYDDWVRYGKWDKS